MNDNDAIVKRLDVLIALTFENLRSQEKIPQAQLFKTIRDTGLTPTEIGKIVNKEGKYVSARITEFEKSKTKIQKNQGKKEV